MIIALTNSKGGVGKSTLAVHLAVWCQEQGATVALVDADAQGSSSLWLQEAAPAMPVFRLQTPDDILDQVPGLLSDYEHLVLDGPAGLSEVTRAILLVADLALLPCGPSVLDLRAAQDAIRVVRQAQKIRQGPPVAWLVPNKLQVQYRLSREFLEAAQALEIPAVPGLRLRQAFAEPSRTTKIRARSMRSSSRATALRGLNGRAVGASRWAWPTCNTCGTAASSS
jgi:chromosome partitioning protein